ncbi:MAG: hypothetical protein ACRYFZ_09555 [Janthinobacterium lividum]
MADLSALYVLNVRERAEEIYAETIQDLAFNEGMTDSANAILANQRAARAQQLLKDSPTDNVDIVWETDDLGTVQDCTSDCDLTGTVAQGNAINISVPKCFETTLSVSKESARRMGRTVEEETAFLLARRMILMDNMVNSYSLARTLALADAAVTGTLPVYATQAGGIITIPAANWGLQMYADLKLMGVKNRMGMPFVIDDGALFTYLENARLNQGNDTGKGDAARATALAPYEDILGFTEAGITTADDFIIKRGALALFYKTFNPDAPELIGGTVQQVRSTMASKAITAGGGISYDMFTSLGCSDIAGTKSHSDIGYTVKLKANIGVWKAPGVGTAAGRPGILAVKRAPAV